MLPSPCSDHWNWPTRLWVHRLWVCWLVLVCQFSASETSDERSRVNAS